jgi:hypothetical protein
MEHGQLDSSVHLILRISVRFRLRKSEKELCLEGIADPGFATFSGGGLIPRPFGGMMASNSLRQSVTEGVDTAFFPKMVQAQYFRSEPGVDSH